MTAAHAADGGTAGTGSAGGECAGGADFVSSAEPAAATQTGIHHAIGTPDEDTSATSSSTSSAPHTPHAPEVRDQASDTRDTPNVIDPLSVTRTARDLTSQRPDSPAARDARGNAPEAADSAAIALPHPTSVPEPSATPDQTTSVHGHAAVPTPTAPASPRPGAPAAPRPGASRDTTSAPEATSPYATSAAERIAATHAATPSAERVAAAHAASPISEPVAIPPRAAPVPEPPSTARLWWRAFPMWERRALAVIVALAALMYGWEAAHASYHGFYAVAVRSMTTGWRAFIFGALDPNASITIDKIPGFLWPQAMSAMVFGFHPWSLALPQAVEGLVTVLALHAAVRRWAGPVAGVTAAGIFALTPVVASLFGKVLEDAALTCMLVLAAAAWQRAVESGRLRWLVLCGVWVGLAFQAKMLQSWAVLPAFAIAYLIAAPPRFTVRLRHTLVAGAACLAVSLSWVIIATLTPAADRPYVDGSTNNSPAAMVFGYNGLARFGSVGVSAAGTGSVAATQGARFGGGSSSGWLKLLQHDLASQVGWLYPVALLGIVFGLWRRGRSRTDVARAGTLMWTGWLLMTGLALSAGSVPHSTYVVALAPPLAALSAYALVRAVAMYRAPRTTGERLVLPALTATTLAWAVHLSAAFPRFLPGVALPLSAAAVTAVAFAVAAGRVAGRRDRMTRWSAGLCCTLMLAVPAAWSVSVFDPAYAGSSGNANAGGYQGSMHFGLRLAAQTRHGGRTAHSTFNPFNPETALDSAQSRLLAYLADHRDGARYLVATESWGAASPYILADTAAVLPMGGFSGNASFPQPQQFQAMINTGEIHYVLLTGRGMHVPGARAAQAPAMNDSSDLTRVAALVAKSCRLVPMSAYGAVPQETAPLYRCG
jgi:4-amino-4-deoxy-L-arabinose transferase-like glycosyltransferase